MPRFGKAKENVQHVVAMARVDASPEDSKALIATMERCNEAANWLAGMAIVTPALDFATLQKKYYAALRKRFGLPSEATLLVIAKVAASFKRNPNILPTFRAHGAVAFDVRNYKLRGETLSIRALDRRISGIPLRLGPSAKAWLVAGRWKEADLILRRDGKMMLAITVALPVPPPAESTATLGVDMGIVNLAVDSDGEVFSGAQVEAVRQRYVERRRCLQREKAARSHKHRAAAARNGKHVIPRKTRSLRKKLAAIGNGEARYRKDVNHCISKRLVAKAQGTQRRIALEDLQGIREGTTVRHEQRARHKGWAYAQLRGYIEYKAARRGIPVLAVPARGTSTTCLNPACRHRSKRNRKTRDVFLCVKCGFTAPADFVGACNTVIAADVEQPIVPRPTCDPPATAGNATRREPPARSAVATHPKESETLCVGPKPRDAQGQAETGDRRRKPWVSGRCVLTVRLRNL